MHYNLPTCWKAFLKNDLETENFKQLTAFIKQEEEEQTIFPPENLYFSALNKTLLNDVKVVILGQDPYHNHGQANGLSFSVADGVRIPPSLKNIYKELQSDIGISTPSSGNLEPWAKQGVLLLNATLTVRAHEPGSHQKKGWEQFTNTVIQKLSEKKENLVFILWGNYAQKKIELIDDSKHYILKSVHPSPFSARNGFFGSKPFSKTNEYLTSMGKEKIDWSLHNDCHQLSLLE
jgi:uracil-DNA glycosylase